MRLATSDARKDLSVLYVSSEEFTNDLITSIRGHATQAFREKYRRTDVLLIDDIQFIAAKNRPRKNFSIPLTLYTVRISRYVITSDRSPKAMSTLEERLRSRFEWGLIADIQPPDYETRVAILRSKAERMGKVVPAPIMEAIAQRMQSNIRELEGALNRIVAHAELRNIPLTAELVDTALVDLMPQRRQIEPKEVVRMVAEAFGITFDQIMARDRSRAVALPRQIAMYLLREEAQISLPQIGEVFGRP